MPNQICSGLVASLLILALTACGGGGELVIKLELPTVDCTENFFHTDCDTDDIAIAAREMMCLADTSVDVSCLGNDGIATLFCKDNPNDPSPACMEIFRAATSICTAALDPFRTVCADVKNIRTEQVGWCLMSGSRVGMTQCMELNDPCVNDPFTVACEAQSLDDFLRFNAQFNRIQHCSSGTVGCVGYRACTNTNPFGAGCVSSQFAAARATRIALCTGTPDHASCTGMNVVGDGTRTISYCISTNPFDAACTDDTFDATFDEVRRDFVEACNVGSPDAMKCGQMVGGQTIISCINNPFHTDCTDIAFNGVRVDRITKCGAGTLSGADCTVAISNVTTVALLMGTRLDSEPDTANPRNQFLRGTEYNGSNLLGFNFGTAQASPTITQRPNVTSLNLATARFANQSLGGDSSDGVAFFFGTVNAGTNQETSSAYAGILAGTDLGARLTEPSGTTATWRGQFQTIESTPVNTDFTLNITFGAAGGTINAFVQAREGRPIHYLIDGNFDSSGVITGMVNYGEFTDSNKSMPTNNRTPNGQLTGLIGQQGAVGAFIRNNQSSGFNYAGGFVACPLHADGRCENASR